MQSLSDHSDRGSLLRLCKKFFPKITATMYFHKKMHSKKGLINITAGFTCLPCILNHKENKKISADIGVKAL